MQISRGGHVVIAFGAIALIAVCVSYAPESLKSRTAQQVASVGYADEWGYYNDGTVPDYVDAAQNNAYPGPSYDTYPDGGIPSSYYSPEGYYYYDEYELYDPPVQTNTNYGWSLSSGGNYVPFPALYAALVPQAPQQIVVASPSYAVTYRNPTTYSYPTSASRSPQPTCQLSASPSVIPVGGMTTLSWNSQYATQAALDAAAGAMPIAGSQTINGIGASRTFSLKVGGSGGQGVCYALVTVQQQTPSQQLSCVISTNPQIIRAGQSATLAWGSTGAAAATMTGGGNTGTIQSSGSQTITPNVTRTYTLTVRDAAGNTRSCSTGILVQ